MRAYLGNSGTEVVETSIKLARGQRVGRMWWRSSVRSTDARMARWPDGVQGQVPRRFPAAAAGRVPRAVRSRGGPALVRRGLFEQPAPAAEVAAIIVEPIEGEGGYIVPEQGFLAGLRQICDRHGIVLVADEIQSGAGRTGRMWAVEHGGVVPDVVLTAKGIASGMPLRGMVALADLLETWGPGSHGSTYGGNPVACAAALATIDLLEDGLSKTPRPGRTCPGRAGGTPGARYTDDHHGCPRRVGLMIGIEFDTPERAERVEWGCFERGLLVLECGRARASGCRPH